MLRAHVTGTSEVIRTVERFAELTGRSLADEIIATARLVAVSLATSTQPYGKTQSARTAGESRVQSDIYRVFATPASIFSRLEETDEQAAREFWAAYKAEDLGAMRSILLDNALDMPISQAPDYATHQAARNSRGRVKGKQRMLVLRPPALKKYIATAQKRVGFAKAGWAKAADACGGHRGIPAWASGRHPSAPGGAAIRRDLIRPMVILENRVRYIQDVLPEPQAQAAVAMAYERLQKRLRIVLNKTPTFRRAA